ncbi:serine/threonine protein kinase [Halosimplex carlsbadense 2-9-1]|uniref:Serine/threonine protein kinase n=1 Tax=Halosimplex carlsbadense 2-9-1 TaxID=797114 RepID=M0CWI5_9EURY|nr:PQQ-binding-like beta-propeller repeat protein [Halosimplex carlsbadense]ELZ26817.1 serine/threonine protein kinase [Halosimplex carlsbadense 2-9-1]
MARNRASRRQFLATVLGASAAGLSGCGSDGDATTTPGDAGTETPTDTPTDAPTAATPTDTAEPTDTPTATPTDTPEPTATATPDASSLASWPTVMRNDERWGHHSAAIGPHESVTVDWRTEFDQDAVNATPVLADGTLYIGAGGSGDDDGSFHALNPVTGETKWSKDTTAPVTSAAAVDRGFVYVGTTNGVFYALNTDDGSVFWEWDPGSTEDYTAPAVVDRGVYVGSTSSRFYKFDALDGGLEWDQNTYGAITAPPVYADGTVYATSADHELYAVSASGGLEWTTDLGASANGVAHRDRRLFVTSENNRITQVNVRGSTGWEVSRGDAFAATPAVTENRVFAGTRGGTLFAFDVSDGRELWRVTEPSGGVTAPPVVADGTVYVGARDGTVYAVTADTGDLEWSFATSNNIEEAAPILAGGRVYIGSQDGTLYALSE